MLAPIDNFQYKEPTLTCYQHRLMNSFFKWYFYVLIFLFYRCKLFQAGSCVLWYTVFIVLCSTITLWCNVMCHANLIFTVPLDLESSESFLLSYIYCAFGSREFWILFVCLFVFVFGARNGIYNLILVRQALCHWAISQPWVLIPFNGN